MSKLGSPSRDCVGNVGAGVNIELRYHVYNGSCVARPGSDGRLPHDFIFIASLYSTPLYCSLILIWFCDLHFTFHITINNAVTLLLIMLGYDVCI